VVGSGLNTRNRAVAARFQARCGERLSEVMGGVGGMTRTRWWWCGGAALGHKWGVVGLGPNTRNRAIAARFRACHGKRLSEAMGGGGGMVRMRWWRCGGAALGHKWRVVGFGPK
jgi:hypothetical protein